ncbi:DUF6396 domain-containing protein [Limnohabitans sp. Jir72]|uniref:SEL1-like repeat protein n=1 Tax=Limnohabitans sp. Jir72 TaxID=1977909 RepID=UPI000D342CD1|nr:DUF6396 domain-containing protein [Limnohabitans sp. Jir72]PUE33722.1 hypothetical protein B9Z52_06290 [Limnohabitans sp. Jir72]
MPLPSILSTLWPRLRRPLEAALALGLCILVYLASSVITQPNSRIMNPDLPRFTELPAFNPYRKTFTCQHEAQANPVPSEAAQTLFEAAKTLDEYDRDPAEIDYKQVVSLYRQAMALGHWKAQFNLAGLYLEGQGVPFDPNEALRLTEDLMRQGVPAAWFNMGNFYMSGVGPLTPDATVAYAFWQRAADMGSLHAQAMLGKALDSKINEPPRLWANRPIGRQMLECAFAQGSGEAAYQLGLTYRVEADGIFDRVEREALYAKAVQRYHEGVKFGGMECARALSSLFGLGEAAVGNTKDPVREDRYFAISEYLRHHPDTRLPNLDRVLPLPPAKLPTWDGEAESLIKAAQAVRVTPKQPPQPAANAPGRAHIPEGHSLVMPADRSQWAQTPIVGFKDILSAPGVRTGLSMAAFDGYYQPLHIWATHPQSRPAGGIPPGEYESLRMRAMADVPPLHYRAGEPLDLRTADAWNMNHYFAQEGDHRLVYWFYKGTARAVQPLTDHLARAGLVQAIAQATDTRCADGQSCPTSGIWQPEVTNTEHPLAQVFNGTLAGDSWRRQAFVSSGQNLPQFAAQLAPVLADGEAAQLQVKWRLMVACEAVCEAGFEKIA